MKRRTSTLIFIISIISFFAFAYSATAVYAQTPSATPDVTATATLDPDLIFAPKREFAEGICLAQAMPVSIDVTPTAAGISPLTREDLSGKVVLEPDTQYPVLLVMSLEGEDILLLEGGLQIASEAVVLHGDCEQLLRLEIELEKNVDAVDEEIEKTLIWDLQDVEDLVWGIGKNDVDADTGRLDPDVADTLYEWLLFATDEEEFTPELVAAFEQIIRDASGSSEIPQIVERALLHFVIERIDLALDTLVWYGFDEDSQRYALDVYGEKAPEVLYLLTEVVEVASEEDGDEITEEDIVTFVEGWIVDNAIFQLLEQPRVFVSEIEKDLGLADDFEFDKFDKPLLLNEAIGDAVMSSFFEDASGNVYWVESIQTELGYQLYIFRSGWLGEEYFVDDGGVIVLPLDLHNTSYTLGYMHDKALVIEICADDWCVLGEVEFSAPEEETE